MKSFKEFIKEGWENAVASFSGKPSITSGPPISNAIDPYPTAFSKGKKKKKAERKRAIIRLKHSKIVFSYLFNFISFLFYTFF